eukprot:scaffold8177_cov106-Cylindrotheca_fusiformis.AAC.8
MASTKHMERNANDGTLRLRGYRRASFGFEFAIRICALLVICLVGIRKHRCSFQMILKGSGNDVSKARDNNSNDEIKYSVNSSLFAHSSKVTSLPSCMDWIRHNRPSNFPEESQMVEWTKQADGTYAVSFPRTCNLHRFSSAEVEQCLANQHLVMIGDSLSRYQTLDLVYLLEHEEFPPDFLQTKKGERCLEDLTSCDHHFLWHLTYKDWDAYHIDLGGGVEGGGGPFRGCLECQCVVKGTDSTVTLRYVSKKSGLKITFLKEAGWGLIPSDISGWKDSGCAENGTCSYSLEHADELRRNFELQDFTTRLEDGIQQNATLRDYFPSVDHVVFNRGIWGGIPAGRAQRLFPALRDWAKQGCYYKSTTAGPAAIHQRVHSTNEAQSRDASISAGCTNFHLHHLTAKFSSLKGKKRKIFFTDFAHFQPWVQGIQSRHAEHALCRCGSSKIRKI